MNADFLAVLEFWEREKGISRDVLIAAVNEALLAAAKRAIGPARATARWRSGGRVSAHFWRFCC